MAVKELRFNSADDFVSALAAHRVPLGAQGQSWQLGWRDGRWLYRGQACSEWGLKPSAFRHGAFDWLPEYGFVRDLEHYEAFALKAFVDSADEAGLAIPEDSQTFRDLLSKATWKGTTPDGRALAPNPQWPEREFLSALALAKHHGIATRLLDWSRSPHVAAWFAASEALAWRRSHYRRTLCSCRQLSVWILDGSVVRSNEQIQELAEHYEEDPDDDPDLFTGYRIQVVRAPTADNARLRAQQGCFTLLRPGVDGAPRDLSRPLEDVLEDPSAWAYGTVCPNVLLLKYVISHLEAESVLRAIGAYGVSAATVYPGYDGVVESLTRGVR